MKSAFFLLKLGKWVRIIIQIINKLASFNVC